MSDYRILEQYSWFHQQVRSRRFPTADDLAERFGLSARTARRNIDYMRDRLGAPLEFDAVRGGYFYGDAGFELSHLQANQEELLAILIARNLLAPSAGGLISKAISSFGKKLFSATANIGLTEERMEEAFSAIWYGYAPAPANTFRRVAAGLLQYSVLTVTYSSPINDEVTRRDLEPHHLQLYMGSWVLVAWCRLREDWRKFYLSRMDQVEFAGETFVPRPREMWKHQLEGAFGIFQGKETVEVVLRFTAERARWVREQVWHPQQRLQNLADGGVDLVLPVADFREIKQRILQFGCDVEVVQPAALREEIRGEIERMAGRYAA